MAEKEKMNDVNWHRNVLGILGMSLPILSLVFNLLFGRNYNPAFVMSSISATHYSSNYLIFEGLVMATGIFLITYRGLDIKDWIISIIAGIGALVLAFFPCDLPGGVNRNFLMLPMEVTKYFHYLGALVFFLSLAYIILFQFTKTNELNLSTKSRKWKRNILYWICGIVMLGGLTLGFTAKLWNPWPYWVFTGETIALFSFGVAWTTKGGLILKDIV